VYKLFQEHASNSMPWNFYLLFLFFILSGDQKLNVKIFLVEQEIVSEDDIIILGA